MIGHATSKSLPDYPGGMVGVTLQETNMSPENQWLEDVLPTKIVPF